MIFDLQFPNIVYHNTRAGMHVSFGIETNGDQAGYSVQQCPVAAPDHCLLSSLPSAVGTAT
jgi:hypothetical protein